MSIESDRGAEYGGYASMCLITQTIKRSLRKGIMWTTARDTQRESLELIATKLARIVNGNPNNIDSWRDIAGYANLIVKELEKQDGD